MTWFVLMRGQRDGRRFIPLDDDDDDDDEDD
jgi:hypothetical protein